MADITNELNAISTAMHGSDVRTAIHDALQKTNTPNPTSSDLQNITPIYNNGKGTSFMPNMAEAAFKCIKINGIVYLQGAFLQITNMSDTSDGASVALGVLPAGYRPIFSRMDFKPGMPDTTGYMRVQSDGQIIMARPDKNNMSYICFYISFPAAEE